jgi:hypothetical protein
MLDSMVIVIPGWLSKKLILLVFGHTWLVVDETAQQHGL